SCETYFITPVMGGEKIRKDIIAIRPVSPVGISLMGKEEGDTFKFMVADSSRRKGTLIRQGEIVEIL
ncbi:MAG: hypothetical protein HQK65_21370, partial [Desulfamplus sp.]|nr:hypothetical protein [Desulfamplus sp.]